MKQRIFTAAVMMLFFTLNVQAQYPGEESFPPEAPPCPPPAWCDPGPSSFMNNDDIDAVADALSNPECDNHECLLGYYFLELIRPLYPDCYPNCNLEEPSVSNPGNPEPSEPSEPAPDEGGSDDAETPAAESLTVSAPMTKNLYRYLSARFGRAYSKRYVSGLTKKGLNGGKLRTTGQFGYNKGEKNEFRVIRMQVLDAKNRRYDTVYFAFNKEKLIMINHNGLKDNWKSNRKRSRRGKY